MPDSALLTESELAPADADGRAGKYLIFRLGRGEFGAAINKLREVVQMQGVTRVPNSPAFIAGVVNLRGKVIPVIDLRLIFGLASTVPTPQSCIIIARVALASVEQTLGILVDAVTEVLQLEGPEFLEPEELQSIPECGTRDPAPYLLGVARVEGGSKLILDLDEVLNNLDLRQLPVFATAA